MKRAVITGDANGEHLFVDEDLGYTMMGSVMRDDRGVLRTKLHFMLGLEPAMFLWRYLNEYRAELIARNQGSWQGVRKGSKVSEGAGGGFLGPQAANTAHSFSPAPLISQTAAREGRKAH